MRKAFLILIATLLVSASLSAEWTQKQQLDSPEGVVDFPSNIYMEGDYAIIGDMTAQDDSDIATGVAYVYHHSGTSWDLSMTLQPNDGEAYDYYGYDACFNDDFIFVGAYGSGSGAVYVHTWDGTQVQKITGSFFSNFGYTVCVEGDFLFVGTRIYDGVNVYHYDGTSWVLVDTLMDTIPSTIYFGRALAIDGDYLVIGASGDNTYGLYAGLAYVYHWNGTNWEFQDTLPYGAQATNKNYGSTVSISGDRVVVGGANLSNAYAFERNGTEWNLVSSLVPDGGLPGSYYGQEVAIDGDYVLVSASSSYVDGCSNAGAAYLFYWDGTSWVNTQKLVSDTPQASENFGSELAISGSRILIGNEVFVGEVEKCVFAFDCSLPGTGEASGTPADDDPLAVDVEPLDAYDYDGNGAVVVDPDVDVNPSESGATITVDIVVVPGNENVIVPENAALTYRVTVTGTSQPVQLVLHFSGLPFSPTEIVWNSGGEWSEVEAVEWDNVLHTATFTWTFDTALRDGGEHFVVNNGEGTTLPVELSSFTATLSAGNSVMLNWTTQSESDMLGYRVLRAENGLLEDAMMINASLIVAGNSPNGNNYLFNDVDVEEDATYSYWLEAVEMNGISSLYGPTTVTITYNEEDPEEPPVFLTTTLGQNTPNPFNPHTTINYSIADDSAVSIKVYNTRGQLVRTLVDEVKVAGTHTIEWNGTDASGKSCSSGIYFYKMETTDTTEMKKMMILK